MNWIPITYNQLVALVLMENNKPLPTWPAPMTPQQVAAAQAFTAHSKKQAEDAWKKLTSQQQTGQ